MGKYDDAIGGGKIIVDVEEILNEEAADKVDKKIKTQKAELEKPIKVTVEIEDKSIGKLKQLTEAVKKNSDNLQQAMQSGRSISELSDYIQTHKQLERQIKAVTKMVKSNNTEVSKSKQVLIDAQNIIDQISISIEKNNRIDYLDKTVKGATQAVSAISKFQQLCGDLGKKYGEATFSSIFGGVVSSFKAIDESNASQAYDALIVKDREYQSQLEEESKVRERITQEVKAYAEATKYIYKNGEPSQDILNAYASYWEKVSAGAMSATDAVKAFEEEWNQLGGAVDYQQKQQIDEIRSLIRNQKEWLKYLEQSLNSDNFKTSGKKEATQQLRDLTSRLIYARKNNYQDDAGDQYNRQMIEVAWAQGYKEAQRQNVAQSTLTRYYTDALGSYDDNLRVLQEQYAFRQKLLAQYEEELEKIGRVTSEMKEQKEAKNDIVPSSQAITSMSQLGEVLDAVRAKYKELHRHDPGLVFESDIQRAKTALEELNDVDVLSALRDSIDQVIRSESLRNLLLIPQGIKEGYNSISDFGETIADQFRIAIKPIDQVNARVLALAKALKRISKKETGNGVAFDVATERLMQLLTKKEKEAIGVTDRNISATKYSNDDVIRPMLNGLSTGYASVEDTPVSTMFTHDLDSVIIRIKPISNLVSELTRLEKAYPAAKEQQDKFFAALRAQSAANNRYGELSPSLEQLQAVVDQFPEAQQYIDKIQSRIQKPVVQQPIETTPAPIQEETKAIKDNTQATEENIKAKKKLAEVKLREFTSGEYDEYTEKYEAEHDGEREYLEDTVDLIHDASQFGTKFAADMQTSCKKAATAVKRFFSAIDPEKYPALASWKDGILEAVQSGTFSERETYNGMFTNGYSWGVEALDDDRFYVYLNLLDVAKDKETEYEAYLQEESRKRDEGLQKESELVYKLYSKYSELAELRKNKPNYDRVATVDSYQRLIEYYEKEKILLQDILSLENEIRDIPGQYKSGTDFRNIHHAYSTEKVTKSSLESNEFYIREYRKYSKELEDKQKQLEAQRQSITSATAETTSTAAEQLAQGIQQVGDAAEQAAQQLEQQIAANETLVGSSEQAMQQVEQQVTGASTNTEPTQLELFDKEFPGFAQDIFQLDPSGELYSKLQSRMQDIRSQVEQGMSDACDAYAALTQEMAQVYAEMTPPTPEMRKMSMSEYSKFMKGIDFDQLFSTYGIDKENQGVIRDAFAKLGDIIVSKGNSDKSDADIQGQIDNISNLILQYAKEQKGVVEDALSFVLDELRGKIFYDQADVKSIGKERFQALKSQINSQKIKGKKGPLSMTTVAGAGNLDLDSYFTSQLSEQIQNLIASTWEQEHGSQFNANKANIMEGIALLYQKAADNQNQVGQAVFDKLQSPDAIKAVMDTTNSLIDTAIGNAEQLLRTEQQITDAIDDQNHVRAAGNEEQRNAIQNADNESENERQSIVERVMKDALDQLRTANNNNKAQISFDGVFTPEALLGRFQKFAKNINGLELDVGKIRVHGDTAQVQLYNDALKVTVDQTWRLKEATEGAEAALEFVDQSFSQNIKALNENTFDVSGVRDKANSEIAKLQADADRAKYSLEELKNLASNIASEDDYKKFNTQLQAARNNIQAIKNSTITKGSMNPLANMQRDMQNANIELDTMELKLEKLGNVQGVEDARDTIKDMRASVEEFNAAADTDAQQQSYNRYSDLRSTFQKQLEYLNVAKSVPQENSLETYYKNLFDTVQRINSLDSQINTLKLKDGGKGIYSDLIASLENEKSTLLGKIDQIGVEINQYFNGVFTSVGDADKIQLPFNSLLKDTGSYSTILDFLNSVEARATLSADAVNKLVQAFYSSSQAGTEFAEKISAQFKPAEEAFARLQQIISSGGLNVDNDGTYQQMKQRFDMLQQLSQTDMSKWSAEEIAYFTNLAKSVAEYADSLSKAAEQEANYFAGKTKAYAGDTMHGNPQKNELMVVDQPDKNIDTARQALERYVATFTEGKGIITGFTTAANGISQITFSALDEGTEQFRTFTAEMGRCTDNIYRTETTLNSLTSGTNAAKKSIASLVTVMSQLNGVSGAEEQLKALWEVYQNLQNAINDKGNSQNVGDQNMLKNMATDADKARKEVEKLIKEWAKAQAGLDDGSLTPLGSIDKNGNIKEQMWENIKTSTDGARASFVDFDEKTNTLTYTLTNADKTVTTMTAHMYGLNGAVVAQAGKTEELKTGWQDLTGALNGALKGVGQYLGRAFSMWAIVGQLKQGFNAVKQIDAALTELKKVTDETEGSYQRFLNTASQTAGKIGSTVSDFTQASANFARLGYTMEESAKMAETAIVYKNVADGLDTVEESTESIISTMKAFGIESSDTMGIIDRFNEVGNNFAITSAGIGEALQRSASALYEAGNTIDESIGLVTAANSVVEFVPRIHSNMNTRR